MPETTMGETGRASVLRRVAEIIRRASRLDGAKPPWYWTSHAHSSHHAWAHLGPWVLHEHGGHVSVMILVPATAKLKRVYGESRDVGAPTQPIISDGELLELFESDMDANPEWAAVIEPYISKAEADLGDAERIVAEAEAEKQRAKQAEADNRSATLRQAIMDAKGMVADAS